MKRIQSNEPDLYVVNKKITDKEAKEVSDFIKEYKAKNPRRKSNKPKTTYSSKLKTSIAAEPENRYISDTGKIIREPDGIDFVVINKKLTEKESKELSDYIKKYKHQQKLGKKQPGKSKYTTKIKTSIAAEPKAKYRARKKAGGKSK